ncbi:DUF5958 family protein [Streptomyces antibioticus]|uniref:DUF5958 family protein n=1 Tax=Streptomyces antibioticus TaxID=1890 RepID=UPI003F48F799
MGLNVVVGVLGNAEDNHTSMVRAELVAIGKLLERAGAPQWAEPELDDGEGADFEAWGCAGLHTVRPPTANPSVMICMDPPRYGFASLPADEHVKAFRVLVSVFTVADTRRRETYCKGTCGHAWHNLPAENVQP